MTCQTTCILTLSALVVALTQAQEPIPLPIPDPVSTATDDRDERETNTDERSILVESSEASNRIPLTPAPEIEKPLTTIDATDSLSLESPQPAPDGTLSSSVDGLDTTSSQPVIVENPFEKKSNRPSVVGENRQPARVPAPVVKRSSQASPQSRTDSQRAVVTSPQRVVIQRRFSSMPRQRRPAAMTRAETTTYRAVNPNAVRPARYEQRFRRASSPGVYRQVGSVVTPVSDVEAVVVPSRRLARYGYAPGAVTRLRMGGPRGPAGQLPQPGPFVPGQPLRNFVRGFAPY